MNYLKSYCIDEDMLKEVERCNEKVSYCKLEVYSDTVKKNLKFLTSKGFINVYNLLKYKLNILFERPEYLKNKIDDKEEIIDLINEDIDNFELIGY